MLTISSSNIADGDPVQRARVAYEISKKEYERMKALVKNQLYPIKNFHRPNKIMKMPVSVTKHLPKEIPKADKLFLLLSADT